MTSSIFATLVRGRRRGGRHRADRAAAPAGPRRAGHGPARLEEAPRRRRGAPPRDLGMTRRDRARHRRQPAARRGPLPRHRDRHAAEGVGRWPPSPAGSPTAGANIDRIERMARYPVTAIDLHVSGVDTETLRTLLAAEAAAQGVDVAVQPANLLRRGMRLIVMDVDSHAHPGRGDRDARRARRATATRSPRSPRRRCAASWTSRSRCASG